jgi:hypothetical protein
MTYRPNTSKRWRMVLTLVTLLLGMMILSDPSPAAARSVPFGFFGTVLDPDVSIDTPSAALGNEMGVMARSGIESLRSNIFWDATEPAPGVYDFTQADKLVLNAASHGLELLPIVEFTPAWASTHPHSSLANSYPPKRPQLYAAFMKTLVDRYGPHGSIWKLFPALRRYAVHDWQIWNEPEGNYDWLGKPWQKSYAELLRLAYVAVHRADRHATVVSGAMVGLNQSNLTPWAEARSLYRAGARRYFDVMAVNAFTYSDNVTASVNRSIVLVAKVRAVMDRFGDAHKPIWVTEVTWPASLGKLKRGQYDGFETTASGQVKRLSAYFARIASHRRAGIARAFWYSWASSYSTKGYLPTTPTFQYSGLTRWSPGQQFVSLPALAAYQRVAERYEGCRKSSNARRCG